MRLLGWVFRTIVDGVVAFLITWLIQVFAKLGLNFGIFGNLSMFVSYIINSGVIMCAIMVLIFLMIAHRPRLY